MINQIVAKRYAKALLEIGQEDGNLEQYGVELNRMAQLFGESQELETALANPAIPQDSRRRLLDVFLDKLELSPMVRNFYRLLLDRGRIACARDIAVLYGQLLDDVKGVVRAQVLSAAPLSEQEIQRIKDALQKVAGNEVIIEMKEDPSLIGGVVAKIGDLVLDGSVKSQLESLKESLKRGEYA